MTRFYPFGQKRPRLRSRFLALSCIADEPAGRNSHRDGDGDQQTARKPLRVPDFGVAVGAVADLVVLEARDAREAFATRSPRRWVIRKGESDRRDHA